MKKINNFLKNYYPDLIIQAGFYLLFVNFFQKCANRFFLSSCSHKVSNFNIILPLMLITLGLNLLFRKFYK